RIEGENERAKSGTKQTFSMTFSPDFSRMELTIPIGETSDGKHYPLVGAVPVEQRSSLRAAILRHRRAFGVGSGDENADYMNIRTRVLAPLFPLLSLAMVVQESFVAKAREAEERKLTRDEILLFQPEWAHNLSEKVYERQGQAIWFLRKLGRPICSCRMLQI